MTLSPAPEAPRMSSVHGPASSGAPSAALTLDRVSFRYGRTVALQDVSLSVPTGSVTALLGPNGAGKSTLLQCAVGLLAPTAGSIRALDVPVHALTPAHRARIGYVAESQRLPSDLTLAQYERWLAPLYPTWDHTLASSLRSRFDLDPSRRLRAFSRGQRMQAALLCALAPRPELLIMDEPFAGLDAAIKDDLVRGVLELSGSEGWTVVIASHDLVELELLVDRVVFLKDGTVRFDDSMDALRTQFRWAELHAGTRDTRLPTPLPSGWLQAEVAGPRVRALLRASSDRAAHEAVIAHFPDATRVTCTDASLSDVFIALTREGRHHPATAE